MIVISGALVLVALVLLVLGLTMTDLNFVYGSIAVSLISFVFLVIGILQRRGEQPAEAGASGASGPQVSEDGSDAPTAVAPVSPAKTGTTGSVPVTDEVEEYEEYEDDVVAGSGGAVVLVVPGRPRYHVDGCRYLTGKEVEEVDVDEARAQYSPCGVCKPDAVLAELAADPAGDDVYEEVEEEEVVEEPTPPPAPRARRATSTRSSRTTSASGARSGRGAGGRAGGSTAVSTVDAPDPEVATEPGATEDLDAPAAAVAPAKSTARRKVVVIPDRGRFHTQDCRFVRDALGTEELSPTAAKKQGYKACGVCKP